jgi:hypothetical protein
MSGFKMSFNNEELAGKPPVPCGWYKLQIVNFRPKAANLKPGETEPSSVSLNAELKIIDHPEHADRRVFVGLNTKMAFMWADFVHATGMEMEVVQDEFTGTEKQNYALPGFFENSDTNPSDPSVWKYVGPLLNATMEVELAEIPAEGNYRAKNEVRQFKCAVQGCTQKHSTNLISTKKS